MPEACIKALHAATDEMAAIFNEWNEGDLLSYLIQISGKALEQKDPETGKPVVELIVDKAGQKGTGQWTLLNAAENDHSLGVRGVHSKLVDLDIPLSFLSVREVLKRLCSEGVIVLNEDKSYSLHPRAAAILHGE